MTPRTQLGIGAGIVALLLMTACDGGGRTQTVPMAPAPIFIGIQPATNTVFQGNTLTFRATGGLVTWSVQEGTAGGTVTTAGLYTAPKAAGTYHVVATSQSDGSKSATAIVTVPPVTISIFPVNDVLARGGVRSFGATVASSDKTLDWSMVEGASAGTLTDNTYTAPNSTGVFHVLARYRADPTLTATATVTVVANGFRPTATTRDERYGHSSTYLLDGRVLNVGGYTCYDYYYYTSCASTSASLYDPTVNQLNSTSPMQQRRTYHTATRLADGKVLIIGGGSAIAEVYDPASDRFTAQGSMSMNRSAHTATLLGNGTVLIAGGRGVSVPVATAELYDPQTGTFSSVGSMITPRANHTATRLANGQVLIAGGTTGGTTSSTTVTQTAELYDPATRTFIAAASLNQARTSHSATLLAGGSVLIAGGFQLAPFRQLNAVEIYEPANGRSTATGNLLAPRDNHAALLLPNGRLLLVGGNVATPLSYNWTAELFDPVAGTSVQVGSMRNGRSPAAAAAVVLPDGRVVVTGGDGPSSVEIYQ